MLKYIPNILTLLRFILIVPIVITITMENFMIAIFFLILSGITDVLDRMDCKKI